MKWSLLIAVALFVCSCKKDTPEPVIREIPKKVVFRKDMHGLQIDSTYILTKNNLLLLDLYKRFDYKAIWADSIRRKTVVEVFFKAHEDGLPAKDYEPDSILAFQKKIGKVSDKELMDYDLRISLAVQRFMLHLSQGKLNPKNLYWNWDLRRYRADINGLIETGLRADTLAGSIASVAPKTPFYHGLKKALAVIDKMPDDRNLPKVKIAKSIVRGDTTRAISAVKKRLIYWKDLTSSDSLSNYYDKRTFEAVKNFQARHGLAADGVIGRATAAALNTGKKQRREQIVVNLERWRWFPRYFGKEYVIINIPDYTLSIVKDRDTVETRKIIVGKHDRRTPVLSSTFSNITFNPTWTVPPTILREDLIPSATADRNYFVERDISIIDWKGNTVDPQNWTPDKANRYRYVQSAGDHNALGNVKFNFPNHYTVYLHDTNHKSYFQQNFRSLSSGCVRVENPLEMAVYMLDDEKRWPIDSVWKVVETKETKIINLRKKIRIHQLYWTAWMDGETIHFRDDIYKLDSGLYDALNK